MPPQTTTLQRDDNEHIRRVTGHGRIDDRIDGQTYIAVDGQRFTHSLILTPETVSPWPPRAFAEITPEHVAMLMVHEPQVILIGTGATQRFPAPALLQACMEKGIGVEAMTTIAACRTYNLLAGEGRAVVAALLVEAMQ
ncbi:MAG: Xcc1710-like domain-containing protein [Gammaproteobacteria bacterium]|nr:Xcc1710-like domain-containing protein [Gammaproteobacteria bacterium]